MASPLPCPACGLRNAPTERSCRRCGGAVAARSEDPDLDYRVPKPVPGWVVRLIGAGMILPFIAMIVGKVRPESSPVLFFGSAIAFFAGIFLLRGRTPWVG